MPSFDDSVLAPAPPEQVWLLLYDPYRFPEWWEGIETIELNPNGFTLYPTGYPDFPMPQLLRTDAVDRSAVISCLVSDLEYEWTLLADGDGTRIAVHVDIPEQESARLGTQQQAIRRSLVRLAAVAAAMPESSP